CEAKPQWKPEITISGSTQYLGVQPYGMTSFDQLYLGRQLVTLSTFSELVGEVRELVVHDARAVISDASSERIESGGTGAQAYADAVITFLAMTVSKLTSYHC